MEFTLSFFEIALLFLGETKRLSKGGPLARRKFSNVCEISGERALGEEDSDIAHEIFR